MRPPFRLDLSVDLFAVDVDGVAVVTNQAELETLMNELESLPAGVPEPDAEPVWAAVIRVIGRDPRT
jgi:hypothetical protein